MQRILRAVRIHLPLQMLTIAILMGGWDTLVSQDKKAEDFVVYSIEGKRTIFYDYLAAIPGNGVVLLNFTSINCKPCRKEIPELVSVIEGSGGRAKLLCIYSESGNSVRELASELNILDKAYVDPFGNIQKQYDVRKIPVTYVIRGDGTILGRYDGYTEDNIRKIQEIVLVK